MISAAVHLLLLSCVGYINFYQTPEILWELLGTLRSRWAVHFSGNCVPAVKKVREMSSRVFPLKLSPVWLKSHKRTVPLFVRELGPHLTQCRLGQNLPPY